MNILFLTLADIKTISEPMIYTDLLREFLRLGHDVYIISPIERKQGKGTFLFDDLGAKILKVKIGNVQKTNYFEKGISLLLLDQQLKKAGKDKFSDIGFDLILYSTPPITLIKTIRYFKKKNKNAKTYLMLKDIFPQNALDLNMISTGGIIGMLHKYFRRKEKKLYKLSDFIGCMSQGNADYLIQHNPDINKDIVEIFPNSIEPQQIYITKEHKNEIRKKYKIPSEKTVFVFGGNLGKPQAIDFLIECLKMNESNKEAHILIVGSGTEYSKLKKYFDKFNPVNATLINILPKDDYDLLVNTCDVGLITLDSRFTIPNFPSKLLSYMEAGIPVLAATDTSTDVRKTIEDGQFGLWCPSTDPVAFNKLVLKLCDETLRTHMGTNARRYLEEHFTVEKTAPIILKHFI